MKNSSLILRKYRKQKLIHRAPQKQVWLAVRVHSQQLCIIKLKNFAKDTIFCKPQDDPSPIFRQAKILKQLMGLPGIPFMNWSGTEQKTKLLIVQQLGNTLQHHFHISCNKKFTLKTICDITIQIIKIVQTVHQKQYICGKITSKRIQLGKSKNCHKIYLNDFSDCFKRQQQTQKNINFKNQPVKFQQNQFISSCNVSKFSDCGFIHGKQLQEQQNEIWNQHRDIQSIIKLAVQFFGSGLKNVSKDVKYIKRFINLLNKCKQDMQKGRQLIHFQYLSEIYKIKFQNNWLQKNQYDYDWFKDRQLIKNYRIQKDTQYLRGLYDSIKRIKLQNEDLIIKRIFEPALSLVKIDYISQKWRLKKQIKRQKQVVQTETRLFMDDLEQPTQLFYEQYKFQCDCCSII